MVRILTSKFGVGRRLLKWNSQKLDSLRRELHWAYPLLMLATAVNSFGSVTAPATSGGTLSAIATLSLSLVLLVFGVRVLLRGLFAGDRFLHILFRTGSLAAFAIVVMHLTGHLFAAHQYLRSLVLSIVAVTLVIALTNILQRMLLIFRAGIERRNREAQRKPGTEDEELPDEPAELSDVNLLSEAHNRLLGLLRFLGMTVLLWLIWSPALPALNIFNEVALWRVTDATLPEGQLRTVSLATVLLVIAILTVTALMTRHLPALVKVLLMEWGNVTAGSRYAIGMLMQYVLIGVGVSVSLSLLGWEWSKVQWLVAALGVGIGFGLQEIVANFISGIILLFERPIRVGDIITAGGDSGTVTRINPRATIIESFEGKELMIPNKDLITSVVINWSLSSSKLRVVIPVGVAYGSDVRKAMSLLVQVAKDNPAVVDDPEPMASFEDFGDNALTLWLRCYAEGEYVRVWTNLRTEINERFEAAGISIAFPQRDVHLDVAQPIPVRVMGGEARG
jgi:potassium efflux system protein